MQLACEECDRVSASRVQALTTVSVEGETGDRGDDQDYAGNPTT